MSSTRWIAAAAGLGLLVVLIAPQSSDAGQKGRSPQKSGTPRPSTPKGPSVKAGKPAGASAAHVPSAGTVPNAGKAKGGPAKAGGPRGGVTSGVLVPANAVAAKIATKPRLLDRITATLPPGTDLNMATAGFKNFGQFVAAVNVSNNLDIPFADLKAAMTGTTLGGIDTGEPILSLGQAIQQLKPDADFATEAQVATTQAARFDADASVATTAVGRPRRPAHSASR